MEDYFFLTMDRHDGRRVQVEIGTFLLRESPRWLVMGEKATLFVQDFDAEEGVVILSRGEGSLRKQWYLPLRVEGSASRGGGRRTVSSSAIGAFPSTQGVKDGSCLKDSSLRLRMTAEVRHCRPIPSPAWSS